MKCAAAVIASLVVEEPAHFSRCLRDSLAVTRRRRDDVRVRERRRREPCGRQQSKENSRQPHAPMLPAAGNPGVD
jgi:hypothetical protein